MLVFNWYKSHTVWVISLVLLLLLPLLVVVVVVVMMIVVPAENGDPLGVAPEAAKNGRGRAGDARCSGEGAATAAGIA